jgi:hypothetical protein
MPSRLSEIYKSEVKGGGNLGSAVTKTLKEKIDPRRMIDQSGILPTLFPGLKAYKATTNKVKSEKISDVESVKSVENINFNTELTAKNTLRLPEMARDINVMRQNIQQLVKVMGGNKVSGADMYFKTSDEYERSLESERQKRTGKKDTSPQKIVDSTKEKVESVNNFLAFFNPKTLVSTLTPIVKGLASVIMGPAFLASIGLGGLAYLFYKMFSSKGAFLNEESDAAKGLKQAEKVGGLAGVKDEEEKRKNLKAEDRAYLDVTDLERYTENGVVNDAMLKDISKRSVEHALAVRKYRSEKNIPEIATPTASDFQKTDKDITPVSTPTSTSTSSSPSRTSENVPSNVVRSGSGEPVRTGSGGYLTSGTSSETTSPSKVTSAQIPSASGLPIDYGSYVQKIGEKESGGKYDAVNTLGYLGKYQFGAMALQDMGLVKKGTSLKGLDNPSNWNIEGGKQAFLSNAQLQEDTMLRYTKQNFKTLNRIGVINKDSSPQEVAGYLAASHLLGPGGARELSKGNVGADAYGTSSATYFKVGSATQGGGSGGGTVLATSPSSGSQVSTASSSVSDGQREMMTSASAGTTVIDNSTKTTVASSSPSGKTSTSTYDEDLIRTLIATAA